MISIYISPIKGLRWSAVRSTTLDELFPIQLEKDLFLFLNDQCKIDFFIFSILTLGNAQVDSPTQLICIWIFICQWTNIKDIAG